MRWLAFLSLAVGVAALAAPPTKRARQRAVIDNADSLVEVMGSNVRGLGTVVSASGEIITAAQLARGKEVQIRYRGERMRALVVSTDPGSGLALLRGPEGREFHPVAVHQTPAENGDWLIAVDQQRNGQLQATSVLVR